MFLSRANKLNTTILQKATQRGYATYMDVEQAEWKDRRFFVTGANGQLGRMIVKQLCNELGADRVVASDLGEMRFDFPCKYETLDVTDGERYRKLVNESHADTIVHLAAMLSATSEKQPQRSLEVNVKSTISAIQIATDSKSRLFFPSSIASFGGNSFPKVKTPVDAAQHPQTIYGVSKVFGEQLGNYYSRKFGLDFRGLRYPTVISSEKFGFEGSAQFSTEIFFKALETGEYTCPIAPNTVAPYIYIDDALLATMMLLRAPKGKLSRTTYQVAGLSFSAEEWCNAVKKLVPGLKLSYKPDFRDAIVQSWTDSLDDSELQKDVNWRYEYTVDSLAKRVFDNIDDKFKSGH